MRADEYDALIDDPTGFLYNVWLPRVSTEASKIGAPSTYRNNLACVKGAMAMLSYFYAFGPQVARMRTECGTASAIAGIFKAPFDIIADKLRGYVGLTLDMHTQPDKVLKACEALMPHLCHVGLTTADPGKLVPIGFWMHRGCVPFINPKTVRFALLADAQAHHRGVLEERAPDAVLRRGQVEPSLRQPSVSCRNAALFSTATRTTSSTLIGSCTTNSPSAAAFRIRCSASASRRKSALSAGGLWRRWRATAVTSWMPAPSCRTTRASRICAS